eukprot:TRINITY_DN52708_c0_g1_i1.p1 TRINITY_DN52708_c0_g1~~TRINITY_DN52708_c0_g1_i1.p1  ORF type:complete len:210 (-),score=15.87 TRINITY_DN52708_c0_g1_i1:271-900(-)
MEAAEGRPLRVLCLHGFGQTAESMASMIQPLATALQGHAEFIVPPQSQPWWRASSLLWPSYVGCDESLEFLRDFAASNGPFDGVLGFSQGACLAGIMCAMQGEVSTAAPVDVKFAVICCGFCSRDSQHSALYHQEIDVPSLHVIGEADFFVLRYLASSLARCFTDAKVSYHPGGHDLPDDIGEIVGFIREQSCQGGADSATMSSSDVSE